MSCRRYSSSTAQTPNPERNGGKLAARSATPWASHLALFNDRCANIAELRALIMNARTVAVATAEQRPKRAAAARIGRWRTLVRFKRQRAAAGDERPTSVPCPRPPEPQSRVLTSWRLVDSTPATENRLDLRGRPRIDQGEAAVCEASCIAHSDADAQRSRGDHDVKSLDRVPGLVPCDDDDIGITRSHQGFKQQDLPGKNPRRTWSRPL